MTITCLFLLFWGVLPPRRKEIRNIYYHRDVLRAYFLFTYFLDCIQNYSIWIFKMFAVWKEVVRCVFALLSHLLTCRNRIQKKAFKITKAKKCLILHHNKYESPREIFDFFFSSVWSGRLFSSIIINLYFARWFKRNTPCSYVFRSDTFG